MASQRGNAPKPLEADPTFSPQDSVYGGGGELESFTTSLKSSITNYEYENGRRYHAFRSGSYPLPNDEAESDRLDIFHHMINLSLSGALHLAPIGENVGRILDIGTGTGAWAIEMGDQYPSADILGVDLSPIQPGMVPPNVRFEVDDLESTWTYGKPFDYIHSRYMVAAIEDWPKLVKQVFQHTKPGGWVEFQDLDIKMYSDDDTFTDDLDLKKWNRQLIEGYSRLAREPCPGPKLEGWLKDAGFKSITHSQYKLPAGPWPKDKHHKEVGTCNLLQLLEGFEAFSLAPFTRALGWSLAEVQTLLEGARRDVSNPRVHSQYDLHVVYAQKPPA